jgi:hypothetical protein
VRPIYDRSLTKPLSREGKNDAGRNVEFLRCIECKEVGATGRRAEKRTSACGQQIFRDRTTDRTDAFEREFWIFNRFGIDPATGESNDSPFGGKRRNNGGSR